MTEIKRLTAVADVADGVTVPDYDPRAHGCGIVHLGPGVFHRAHQAVYTDDALADAGGDWRIRGISLRGIAAADALNPQNGLYTVVERGREGSRGRVIGAIAEVIAAARDHDRPLSVLADPMTRLVTLTVTEKAYGINRAAGGVDPGNAIVAADLANPRRPKGVFGLLAESLRMRREGGVAPFTVLCCDNLPDNGNLLREGVLDYVHHVDVELASWIGDSVAFPASMVDRISPATTDATLETARSLTGCIDFAAVETEPFRQWVIEDRFTAGRPEWEAGGALFVDDVEPYERMKLRMLNGAHSMLAYTGFLAGRKYVRDVMADEKLRVLVDRHMKAAAATLPPLGGIDLASYRRDLLDRFSNLAIAHETYQIAMDGTEKLPQRLLRPAMDALASGRDPRPFAFAVAAWMRYCMGRDDDGNSYALRDPREVEIAAAVSGRSTAEGISSALHRLPGLFDSRLADNGTWRQSVTRALITVLEHGIVRATELESASPG